MVKMGNKKCDICSSATFKYKCPKCLIKYCSIPCYNTHKRATCKMPETSNDNEQALSPKSYYFKTEDTVLPEKLNMLGESRNLIELLKDHELRDMLRTIDTSPHSSRTIQIAMQNPVFVKFVDECLSVVEPFP